MKKEQHNQEAIVKLIDKAFKGTISPFEKEVLNQWYNAHEDEEVVIYTSSDKDGYKESLYEKTLEKLRSTPKKNNLYKRKWIKIAASISIFLLFSSLLYTIISDRPMSPEYQTYISQAGERKKIMLQDGTIVHINGNSRLKVNKDFLKNRDVALSGEAFFDVFHDPQRPFTISTNHLTTTVLGTSFSVRTISDSVESVVVKSGRVKVTTKSGSEAHLVKGQMTIFQNNTLLTNTYKDNDQFFGWLEGKLVFKGESLSQIAKKLEDWYGVEVILKQDGKKPCSITGTYKSMDIEELLEIISYTTKINYSINGKIVIIESNGC
ncbi:FecR domain-containing protein [Echinicola sp. CAU 1574]|uniref:FecR domain-containing protein n=1 Tax=Echinicola arenosa TaxID=2774144 RepID=A0ABR9AHQ1_9BACT|nr:FecR domain-containing protein [Echinicola arenosa]MBD8487368.1 FecR domain-containing protein [Echinicola arenosa]